MNGEFEGVPIVGRHSDSEGEWRGGREELKSEASEMSAGGKVRGFPRNKGGNCNTLGYSNYCDLKFGMRYPSMSISNFSGRSLPL